MSANPAPPPPSSSSSSSEETAAAAAAVRLALPLAGADHARLGVRLASLVRGGWVERPYRLLRLMYAMLLLCSICVSYTTMLSTSCSCAARRRALSRFVSAPLTRSPIRSSSAHPPALAYAPLLHTHTHSRSPRSAVPYHAYLPRDARAVSLAFPLFVRVFLYFFRSLGCCGTYFAHIRSPRGCGGGIMSCI